METHLQSLRLITFQDVLDADRPIEQEVLKNCPKENKTQPRENPSFDSTNCKRKVENSIHSKQR